MTGIGLSCLSGGKSVGKEEWMRGAILGPVIGCNIVSVFRLLDVHCVQGERATPTVSRDWDDTSRIEAK